MRSDCSPTRKLSISIHQLRRGGGDRSDQLAASEHLDRQLASTRPSMNMYVWMARLDVLAALTHPMFPLTFHLLLFKLNLPKGALMKCVTGPTRGTSEKTRWTPMYCPTEP